MPEFPAAVSTGTNKLSHDCEASIMQNCRRYLRGFRSREKKIPRLSEKWAYVGRNECFVDRMKYIYILFANYTLFKRNSCDRE